MQNPRLCFCFSTIHAEKIKIVFSKDGSCLKLIELRSEDSSWQEISEPAGGLQTPGDDQHLNARVTLMKLVSVSVRDNCLSAVNSCNC